MYNINQLKRRINSIAKTQKITYAMRLVAMSLYNRIERRRVELAPYISEIKNTFKLFTQHRPIHEHFRATTTPVAQEELIIVISSSKGLCGGFHEHLRKFFKQRYKKDALPQKVLRIGQKTGLVGGSALTDLETVMHYEAVNAQTVHQVAEEVMTHIYTRNYKTVRLFCNRFVNFFAYRPTEIILYPLSGLSESDAREQSVRHVMSYAQKEKAEGGLLPQPLTESFAFEQSFEDIQHNIVRQYGISLLTNLMSESLISEQSARFISMDTATKNASAALERLKLQCNKLRQTLITREVAELSRTL